jgi:MFS family permease
MSEGSGRGEVAYPARGFATAFRALRHRGYRLYFYAFCANQMGFWLANLALQGVMVGLTDNDPSWIGRLFFALFSPALLFSPLAGVAADRFDRRHIMIGCYLVVAATSAMLAFLSAAGRLGPYSTLGLAFLCGVCFAIAGPASSAVAANIVETAELASAISLQSTANNLTRVLGPTLAAPLIATGYYAASFAIFAVASLVAAGFIYAVEVPDYEREGGVVGVWDRVRTGLTHASQRYPAIQALITASVLSIFGVAHIALIPSFAEEVLGSRESFPLIFASTGVGATIGALVTGVEGRPTLHRSTVRLSLYGLSLVAFAFSPNLLWALIAEAVVGFFYFAVMTSLQTLIQEVVDESKRGRVMSLFHVAWGGLFPLGALVLGEVAKAIGVTPAVTGAGAVCAVFGAAATLRWHPR